MTTFIFKDAADITRYLARKRDEYRDRERWLMNQRRPQREIHEARGQMYAYRQMQELFQNAVVVHGSPLPRSTQETKP